MKKNRFDRQGIPVNLRKMFSGMKLRVVFILLLTFTVSSAILAQSKTVTLNVKSEPLSDVLIYIKDATGVQIIFNENQLEKVMCGPVSLKDVSVKEAIDAVLKGKGFFCEVLDGVYVIKRETKKEEVKKLTITGKVVDVQNNPLPGVTVRIKGTTLGVATDVDGNYSITLTAGQEKPVLVFSFVGMTSKEVVYADKDVINVTLEDETSEIDEVVVTGIFKKAKESYTGAVSSITSEQLKMYKGQNVLQTLKNIDASLNFMVNNAVGSNPNAIPQINIRGNSSLPMSVQEYNESASNAVNTPLIIMDGFEITLEKLMDYNDDEIESINILKDAAATAIYGSRGSNGVIVVITKQPEAGKLRINAEIGMDIEAPDLSSYDLLNAAEKLQLEKMSGLYESSLPGNDVRYTERYNKRLKAVLAGVDTDWLSKPLHTGVGSHYNLRMEGGSEQFRWSGSLAYKNVVGAMKGSSRRNFNGSITLMYTIDNLIFKNYTSYGMNRGCESRYGSFSTYAEQQPYDAPYDENGNLVRYFDGFRYSDLDRQNPLYDASLNSFDKTGYQSLTNNFSIEWNIMEGLMLRGQLGISSTDNSSDYFLPAEHSYFTTGDKKAEYATDEGFFRRGLYRYGTGKEYSYSGNVTMTYNRTFAEKHLLSVGIDWSLAETQSRSYSFELEGFSSEDMSFLGNARQYMKDGIPNGLKTSTRRFGLTGNVNYIYDGRYYVDLAYRVDGSSTFGSDKKYAPFWSSGIGWNLHNESFLQGHPVITMLRLKGSYGETGSQQGSSTGASTTYKYSTDNKYMNWNGAILQGWGNPRLTWQKTNELNVGMEVGLWAGRLKGELNVYTKKTANLLSSMDLPLSMGYSSYIANVGEVKNNGWELALSGYAIRDYEREVTLMFSGQLVYNKNRITKLSEAIKAQNELYLQEDVDVSNLFYEGRPQNAIYAVRSLGIDPSTGNEIFLDKDGNITDTWKPSDKVYLGAKEQKYRGNGSILFMWKGLTVNVACSYYWGGKAYNETLLNKVEVTKNTLTSQNVDARVLKARWFQAGDVTFFKQLSNTQTRATSRFVMNDNVFEISSVGIQYRWDSPWVQKYTRAGSITFGVNMSDILHLSSIKMERGTSYPYARNIQGYIKFLF
ncbi:MULTISPECIES: SusC/RagA family TonB-linked outer membrane protein [Butyricimonas]|uniref:SusC/RagA family TonB-linked outer membrane protein n=1 Tax=Butyricimonas TaxID=574697 RepID=UPI000C072972|nr:MULTISPECIES: SusC/RagA family TonB-linked outer membrane protein [Butyricimonas]MCB6973756.1 SusC/RagA family TonB-linked outer membrane protein [Butyricimonas synergistica]MCG4520567.1 SusC/RagA family TonB-linked outer membrane protein [Butyricimonas sp. DFI.6.44]